MFKKSKKLAWVHIDLINWNMADGVFRDLEHHKKAYQKYDKVLCVSEAVKESMEKKYEIFEKIFNGSVTQTEFEKQNSDVSSQIDSKQNELQICRRTVALSTKYGSECPLDILKRLYNSDELTKEHMQFVKRINVFDSEHFEIIMHSDSPLAVLCKNIDIYDI